FESASTVIRKVDTPPRAASWTSLMTTPHGLTPAATAPGERRTKRDRRQVDLGRTAGNRRSGRDRRGGRLLRLRREMGRTLVAAQPLHDILAGVADLVFDAVPAERTFLLLRDASDQPLIARVMRNRDGSLPAHAAISRTIVDTVVRDRVAM